MALMFRVRVCFKAWVPVNALAEVIGESVSVRGGGGRGWTADQRLLMAATMYDLFREVFHSHVDAQTWEVMKQTVQPTGRVERIPA